MASVDLGITSACSEHLVSRPSPGTNGHFQTVFLHSRSSPWPLFPRLGKTREWQSSGLRFVPQARMLRMEPGDQRGWEVDFGELQTCLAV